MKKLLLQLDTDACASSFDSIVAYDGGADHVISYCGIHPGNVCPLVDGAIFTRAPSDKKNTAIFIGGSDVQAGEKLMEAVQNHFFPGFRVSMMLDSNGCNTTAAAGVTRILGSGSVRNRKAVVLAGTGPVGMRAAAMLAMEGAQVSLSSRQLKRAHNACAVIQQRFALEVQPLQGQDHEARATLIEDAEVVFACGKAGVELLSEEHWKGNRSLQIIADANATPPLGIAGIDTMDKGELRHGIRVWGAIGFGALKLSLHRACIQHLFESNELTLDAKKIFEFAKKMA